MKKDVRYIKLVISVLIFFCCSTEGFAYSLITCKADLFQTISREEFKNDIKKDSILSSEYVKVNFDKQKVKIDFLSDNIFILNNDEYVVKKNSEIKFMVTPFEDFEIDCVKVNDSINLTANNIYSYSVGEEDIEVDVKGYTLISTKNDLYKINDNLNENYKLVNDIMFESVDFEVGGEFYNNDLGWIPIGNTSMASEINNPFTGIFDGNGYFIKGL